ncbi:hypothetical protein D3C75_357240 [compost metagenome]
MLKVLWSILCSALLRNKTSFESIRLGMEHSLLGSSILHCFSRLRGILIHVILIDYLRLSDLCREHGLCHPDCF